MEANGLKQTLAAAKGHEKEDSYAKNIFCRKEFLSVILKNVVAEYRNVSKETIMGLIEGDTITVGTEEVSMDAQNTIRGENTESSADEEALSRYDVFFRSLLPHSDSKMLVNLHIDLEIQDEYYSGYPIIKRAVYYASRAISKQLRKVTDKEKGYGKLEKVYSIWLCLENVPQKLRNTVSYYRLENYKNDSFGREVAFPEDPDSDLMEIVLVRLGEEFGEKTEGESEEKTGKKPEENELMDTLQGIFSGDVERALKYVPQMSEPDEKEVVDMLMMTSYSEKRGEKKGRKEGFELFSAILQVIRTHSTWTNAQVAENCGCDEADVERVRKEIGSLV